MAQELALGHLKVVDLTGFIAGPYCTKLLADMGANVIKVEKPMEGDVTRDWGPFLGDIPGKERSGLFWYLNTNKRSIALDLKKGADLAVLKKLISQSDVVVENFSPGVMSSLGLGYESLKGANPSLVMTSISDFGQDGPYRDYRATDIVANAITGLMSISGMYDREPLKRGLHQAAFRAGQYAAVATLAGVFATQATGQGQHIDVSSMECLVTGFIHQLMPYVYAGEITRRAPKSGLSFGGHVQPIETSDGYAIPGTGTGATWQDLGRLLEEPALLDPEFSTPAGREAHGQQIDAILARNFKKQRRYELVRTAQEKRFHFAVVQSIKDLLECPHLNERGYFVEIDHPLARAVKLPGAPFKMSRTPYNIRRHAPDLGEHSSEVRAEVENWSGRRPTPSRSETQQASHRLPLHGVRVLEPAAAVAGPAAGKLLALLGAEVIKIESLVRPCNLRGAGRGPDPGREPAQQYWNESGSHNDVNLGKRNITLDFRTDEGKEAFKELVSISDVVLENFTPRVMKGFGLGYDDLVKIKPDLIMLSVTGYGHTGTYRDYATMGMGIEVATGCAWVTGYLGGPPARGGMPLPDDITAVHALFATLAALSYRNVTGKGQWIDASMYEAGHFVAEAIMDYVLNGREGERLGNRDRNLVPQGCYRCLGDDQWVTLSISSDAEWKVLCNLIGRKDMAADPGLQTKEQRWQRHDEIDRYIAEWTQKRDKVQAMHELQQNGIAAGAVLNNKDVLLNAHLRSRDYFAQVVHKNPHLGKKVYPGLPYMFDGARLPNPIPAAELGEDNWPVLKDLLGMNQDTVREWEKRDIIGTIPLGARKAKPREVTPMNLLVERGVLRGYDTDFDAILESGKSYG
ncbi:MAG: CoA transferase [Dehalococcoidia bacterium]|nr:CoA transferase [Dehalococcoidia bacterium]